MRLVLLAVLTGGTGLDALAAGAGAFLAGLDTGFATGLAAGLALAFLLATWLAGFTADFGSGVAVGLDDFTAGWAATFLAGVALALGICFFTEVGILTVAFTLLSPDRLRRSDISAA